MDPLPNVNDILLETQAAFRASLGTTVAWRDRYGHVVFAEAFKANLMLHLLKWAEANSGGSTSTELIEALAKLTTAVYRS
tara:strand:- start:30382 stop:30621 length:240 start_codon:yes stop_codon:yes gene_type:complete